MSIVKHFLKKVYSVYVICLNILPACLYMYYTCEVAQEFKRGPGSPWNWSHRWTWAAGGWWEWNPGLLQGQPVPLQLGTPLSLVRLMSEPSLPPLHWQFCSSVKLSVYFVSPSFSTTFMWYPQQKVKRHTECHCHDPVNSLHFLLYCYFYRTSSCGCCLFSLMRAGAFAGCFDVECIKILWH